MKQLNLFKGGRGGRVHPDNRPRPNIITATFKPSVGNNTHRWIPPDVFNIIHSGPVRLLLVGKRPDGFKTYSVIHADPRIRGWFVDEDMITIQPDIPLAQI